MKTKQVNRRFVRYMRRKGHLGQVKVNREARTLDIKVVVHGSQQQAQQQQPATATDAAGAAAGSARGRLNIFTAANGGEGGNTDRPQQQQPAAAVSSVREFRKIILIHIPDITCYEQLILYFSH